MFGTGGFAREVAGIVESHGLYNSTFLGFIDDNPDRHFQTINGYPVLGGQDWLCNQREAIAVFLGVGNPETRYRIVSKLKKFSCVFFPILIHPNVVMGRDVECGEGSIICAGNILTCNIQIGCFVNLNLDCTVGHDTSIDDFSTIAPGVHISGNVKIERGCDLGTGASIIQGVSIGASVILGAGAVVSRNLPEGATAVGVPAKVIKSQEVFNYSGF